MQTFFNQSDYYKILGLSKNASCDEIKRNYKDLAIRYHPDKNKNPNANEMFKKINEAYKTLIDPYSRGKYDAMLENGDYVNIDDIFGMSFKRAMNMFDNIFRYDPFLDNMKNSKEGKSFYSSYSTSTMSSSDKNGKNHTTQKIRTNENGKKDKYYREYYIDDSGKKHVIKEIGNKHLLGSANKKYKLLK